MTWKKESERHKLASQRIKTTCNFKIKENPNNILQYLEKELDRVHNVRLNDIKSNLNMKVVRMTYEEYNDCFKEYYPDSQYTPTNEDFKFIQNKYNNKISPMPFLFYYPNIFVQDGYHRMYFSKQFGCNEMDVLVIYPNIQSNYKKVKIPFWLCQQLLSKKENISSYIKQYKSNYKPESNVPRVF
jgi:hypothetical protein